jgi:hypothetical protein
MRRRITWKWGLGLAVLTAALIGPSSIAAANCPCPKTKMIELYGSVSMYPPKLPGPRLHTAAAAKAITVPAVSPTSVPSMADVTRALPTSAVDRMANPLAWEPLFVQQ